MAYWGIAMDFLGNTLAATPSRADAQAAWDALEKALTIGAKTHCEGDCGSTPGCPVPRSSGQTQLP